MPDVSATIAYAARTGIRPFYYANAHHQDHVPLDPRTMPLIDARAAPTSLDVHGFTCLPHVSAVADFADAAAVAATHPAEIAKLVRAATGADTVLITAPGIVRFSEASGAPDRATIRTRRGLSTSTPRRRHRPNSPRAPFPKA